MILDIRLRQICLVAYELKPVIEQLCHVFSTEVCHVDSAVAKYGLENALLTIGNQFLEVVAPTEEGTAAGRYLDRRGGDGGYMIITQVRDRAQRDLHLAELKVPIANELDYGDYHGLQLHPKYTGGCFFEIDWNEGGEDPDGPWHPAGSDWQAVRHGQVVHAITAAELQSPDPNRLAKRWSEIAGLNLNNGEFGPEIQLSDATIRFVKDHDGRGEGLGAVDLATRDIERAKAQASEIGCLVEGDTLNICGTRFNLLTS
jgi:GNAT superfamily N-acetyltransferase